MVGNLSALQDRASKRETAWRKSDVIESPQAAQNPVETVIGSGSTASGGLWFVKYHTHHV